MRGRGISLGRMFGVDVSADLTVLIIGGLLAWSFSSSLLPSVVPGLVPAVYWSIGIVGALVFLASLLGHELAHSIVARRNDVGVKGITLWLFGGVAELEGDPPGPGAEFRIAAAGPVASVVIGIFMWGASVGLSAVGGPEPWVVMLGWLAFINVFLAAFNLLPGAPLDGGRILGSILWKVRGDRATGLEGAAQVGKGIAVLLMGVGVLEMWRLESIGGLWTIMIGFFLFNAARSEAAYYGAERALSGLTAAGAMLSPVQVTTTWTTVAKAVEGPFSHTSQTALPVVDAAGQVRGLLLMEHIKRLPAQRWAQVQAAELMQPVGSMALLDPTEPMNEVIGRMGPWGYALVLDGDRLLGMIGPAEVQRSVELARARRTGSRTMAGPPPPPGETPSQHWQPPTQG
ncbi:MAG: site-2 protease family protein [Actinomycetia bacterium]|nr:site-2 protease family protein [Actinomycetes bacterium]